MARTASLVYSAALLAFLTACPAQQQRVGTDTTGMLNAVERDYSMPTEEAWQACVQSLQGLDLVMETARHDALGGELVARRANNDLVRINLKALNHSRTRVSVRVDPGDRKLATIVQEQVAREMGLGRRGPAPLGGPELEATYETDLGNGTKAARRVLQSLDFVIVNEEIGAKDVRLDARRREMARIAVEKVDEQHVRVTFSAGPGWTDANNRLVERLKRDFERAMQPGSP